MGLWAVKAAQKSSTDKYSFGVSKPHLLCFGNLAEFFQWLRAEILGAFFNAVFLIALCFSIVLEAVTRLIDPPEINNPKLILIVGSLGLASNLAGFFVLGGHGHSHGPGEDDHSHGNEARAAEEGLAHDHAGHSYAQSAGDDDETIGSVYPEAVISKIKSRQGQRIRFSSSDDPTSSKDTNGRPLPKSMSKSSKKHRRRTSMYHLFSQDTLL